MKQLLGLSVLLFSLLVGISTQSFSDNIFAITEDGKRVLLNPNGTWKYQIANKANNVFDSYSGELVNVSIISAKSDGYRFIIELEVSSNSPTSILKMKTHKFLLYDDGGTSVVRGFGAKDNFGNDMGVKSVSPSFHGHKKEKGLRYGKSKIFSLRTTEVPLVASSFVVLQISSGVFANKRSIELKIPTSDIGELKEEVSKETQEEINKFYEKYNFKKK